MPALRPKPADLALLLTLSVLWGASYAFIKIGVATIAPVTLIAARTVIAGALLLAVMQWRGVRLPRDAAAWRQFALQALLNSVFPYTLLAWGERSVPSALATILNSGAPIFAFLGTWAITRHEAVTLRRLLGVIAGLAGICLVVGPQALQGLGDQLLPQLAIVLSAVCYGGAAIYGRTFKGLDPIVPAAGSLLCGSVILVPASIALERPWTLAPSVASLAALLALSVFSTALALVIYFRLVRAIGSVGTTSQAYLRVPIGVAIGIVFLGEALAPSAWLGLLCVVAGVAAMTIPSRERAGPTG